MTDSTEEDMTMLRWRSTLFQWGIISGNTRNWRRESRKQKKTRWNRSRRCSDCLSADKIFLGNGQVLFKCVWNMKRLFTATWWITFLGGNIRKRTVTLKVVVNTIYSLQPHFFSGVNLRDIVSNQKLLSNNQIDKRQNTSVFVLCYIYVQLILEVLL